VHKRIKICFFFLDPHVQGTFQQETQNAGRGIHSVLLPFKRFSYSVPRSQVTTSYHKKKLFLLLVFQKMNYLALYVKYQINFTKPIFCLFKNKRG